MKAFDRIYVLGAGAIGFPLAAFLASAGRTVLAVHTSQGHASGGSVMITVQSRGGRIAVPVETAPLSELSAVDGLIAVATKSFANEAIAQALRPRYVRGPIVLLQNGIGVEAPFLDAGFTNLYRAVLYATAEVVSENEFTFRSIAASPLGPVTREVSGEASDLARCVADLDTTAFPFRVAARIDEDVWRKVIINAAFNSICPLLEADNGIFARDDGAAELAREIVRECVAVAERLKLRLTIDEIMQQVLQISRGSDGQLISTLQDIRSGKPTEMEYLNLGIARVAASMQPEIHVPRTAFLGRMVMAKSLAHMRVAA